MNACNRIVIHRGDRFTDVHQIPNDLGQHNPTYKLFNLSGKP